MVYIYGYRDTNGEMKRVELSQEQATQFRELLKNKASQSEKINFINSINANPITETTASMVGEVSPNPIYLPQGYAERGGKVFKENVTAQGQPILTPTTVTPEELKKKPEISTYKAGNEVPVSPAVANKLGLISKQEQQDTESKGGVYVVKASWDQEVEKPEDTLANIRSGKVYAYIETDTNTSNLAPIDRVGALIQKGNDVKFSTNPNEIPRNSIILTGNDFSIDNNKLMLHALPTWLEYKIKSEQNLQAMEKQGLIKQYENLPTWKKAVVATRLGLTDYVDTARLLVANISNNAYGNYNDILGEVLQKQANREKNPLGIIEAEIDAFTKGAGLVTISRPLAVGSVTAINKASTAINEATQFLGGSKVLGAGLAGVMRGALIGVTTAVAGISIAKPIVQKEYGLALGRGLILTGVILGGVSGIAEAKKLGSTFGVEQNKIEIKPDKVYFKEIIEKQQGGKTRIYTEISLVDEDTGATIKGEHIGIMEKNGNTKSYYKIPSQKTYITNQDGETVEIQIKEQTIIDKSEDFARIKTNIYSEQGKVNEFQVKHLKEEVSLGYETNSAMDSNLRSIDKSLKTIDELVSIKKIDNGVSQAVRQGTSQLDYYLEKAYSTPTANIGRGEFVSLETEKPFTYYYLQDIKNIAPQISDLTDFTKPVIRGTGTTTSATGSGISATLKRLESIRQLQDQEITASINKANVGRIIPNLMTTVNAESIIPPLITERISKVKEVEAQKKQPKIRSTNINLPPIILNPNLIDEIVDNATQQAQKQKQGTKQVQTPVQKFIQEVELITTPATQQETRTVTRTERIQPRVVTPEIPQIERPIRIVPPRPFFNASLGYGGKDLDTYLRSIQHKLIEAMRLVV